MGSFANSLFKIMLGWLQTAVSSVWSAFTSDNGSSLFNWIGQHWIMTAAVLCCAGLAADLCVYLLRWKPYKVWKSFFSRQRESDEKASSEETGPDMERSNEQYRTGIQKRSREFIPGTREPDDTQQEPDLSKWENNRDDYTQDAVYPEEEPATVTNAGYVVPADSPYRRPVREESGNPSSEAMQLENSAGVQTEIQEDMKPSGPRRRRKLNVSDLFTNPEEELQQFDAPQHMIDSRKAYRRPVYPRGWEKNEDDGE